MAITFGLSCVHPVATSLALLAAAGLVAAAGPAEHDDPRVATRATSATDRLGLSASHGADTVAKAKRVVVECQAKFRSVRDYTCTFVKRERIDGRLSEKHVMHMKARTDPVSFYVQFQKPNRGREAIYIAGRNGGRVVAHDVGIGKLLAGTMNLDPRGSLAMEDCRHPITEAGIGCLIDTVSRHWNAELTPEESRVHFVPDARVGAHPCTLIEAVHPARNPRFLFHMVRLYVDHEHGLPIRFEGYDWPKHPGAAPALVEEYTYLNLRVNVGLSDHDFDANNRAYSYGRF